MWLRIEHLTSVAVFGIQMNGCVLKHERRPDTQRLLARLLIVQGTCRESCKTECVDRPTHSIFLRGWPRCIQQHMNCKFGFSDDSYISQRGCALLVDDDNKTRWPAGRLNCFFDEYETPTVLREKQVDTQKATDHRIQIQNLNLPWSVNFHRKYQIDVDATMVFHPNWRFLCPLPPLPLFHFIWVHQMLIRSNQLAGAGSLNIPSRITPGANPYNRNVFVWRNTKSISNNFKTMPGAFMRVPPPLDLRRRGTGILDDMN